MKINFILIYKDNYSYNTKYFENINHLYNYIRIKNIKNYDIYIKKQEIEKYYKIGKMKNKINYLESQIKMFKENEYG